jgi:hypothetical protein
VPSTTLTIDAGQRKALHAQIAQHLSGIGDVFVAYGHGNFADAERLGEEFADDLLMLDDLGWAPDDSRDSFELKMPAEELAQTLRRLRSDAEGGLMRLWREGRPEAEIAEALDLSRKAVGPYVRELRDVGEDLPYRRPPWSAVEVAARRRRGHPRCASDCTSVPMARSDSNQ